MLVINDILRNEFEKIIAEVSGTKLELLNIIMEEVKPTDEEEQKYEISLDKIMPIYPQQESVKVENITYIQNENYYDMLISNDLYELNDFGLKINYAEESYYVPLIDDFKVDRTNNRLLIELNLITQSYYSIA